MTLKSDGSTIAAMKPNLLERVRQRLAPLRGKALFDLERETKISYDTLLRIRDDTVDPGFSKVQTLAEHFGIVKARGPQAIDAKSSAAA